MPPSTTAPIRRGRAPTIVGTLLLSLLASVLVAPPAAAQSGMSVQQCMDRASKDITVVPDGTIQRFTDHRAPANHTYDLRGVKVLGNLDKTKPNFDPKPVTIGSDTEPRGLCYVGGFVQGTQSRSLDWETLKRGGADKASIFIAATGAHTINGPRVDNMMTGVRNTRDGGVIKNAYYRYIRDDCVENDTLLSLTVEDSLFEGCYVAFSQTPNKGSSLNNSRDSSVLTIDGVLVHSQRMPGGFNQPASARTHGEIFKVNEKVSGPIRVSNSIFLIEPSGRKSESSLNWPSLVTAKNVTVVWTGSGSYPGKLPSGVTVTKDRSVWDNARAAWLNRHGCTSITSCDNNKIANPGGGGQQPPPEPDPEPEPEPDPQPDPDPDATWTPWVTLSSPSGSGKVVVEWTPTKVPGAETFRVKRSSKKYGTYTTVAEVGLGTTRFVDRNVSVGKTYWYRVATNVPDGTNQKSGRKSITVR